MLGKQSISYLESPSSEKGNYTEALGFVPIFAVGNKCLRLILKPDNASPTEKAALVSEHKIHNIIDLRSKSEHAAQSEKCPSPELEIHHDVSRHLISLTGPAFERGLVWRLSWSNMGFVHVPCVVPMMVFLFYAPASFPKYRCAELTISVPNSKLFYSLAFLPRTAAISIIGTHAMQPRGLIGLAFDTLTHSQQEFLEIFTLLAEPGTFPVLIHCTQGKDRTGLSVILVLLLCEIPIRAIAADYRASERELVPEREVRVRELTEMGLGVEFTGCPEGFVESIVGFLEETYGGIGKYLEAIRVREKVRRAVRRNLLVSSEWI
ncbi:hypothetical protein MMC30_004723 [Trapelia coarctata]|nr:hypothetical protein [Trapelia coarctata]